MGLRFSETMTGWAEIEKVRQHFEFRVDVVSRSLFINKKRCLLEGHVSLGSVGSAIRISNGRFEIDLPYIKYSFDFEDMHGTEYRFIGDKKLSVFSPYSSITTLNGAVWRGRLHFGAAELRFPVFDTIKFLKSFKVTK